MNLRYHKTKLLLPITIGMACLLAAVAACFQVAGDETLSAEPCIPLAGSDVDPCERQPEWSVETKFSGHYHPEDLPRLPFSFLGHIRRLANLESSHGIFTPQFYVRGTFIPGSSRCVRDRAFIGVKNDGTLFVLKDDPHERVAQFNCFTDVRVHEYLNGDGPDRLPIKITHRNMFADDVTGERVAQLSRTTPMSWLEGREMVFALSRPNDITIGTWGHSGFEEFWDVQKREDGVIVVVGGWAHIDNRFNYEFTLDRLRTDVDSAMATLKKENDGRVGNELTDREYAQDANLSSMVEYLRLYGAYSVADITPVAAPLVPGETDPDPYGLQPSTQ